ncbi:MAG: 50S ribosomal protein L23 [Phycisphaerae bacterium]
MDIYSTIIRPMVTEKSTHQSQKSHEPTRSREARGGSYTFEVHALADKSHIQAAVEQIYNVRVVDVRTSIMPGKKRRYRLRYGQTSETKKAIVVLHPDSHIDLF